MEFEMFIIIFFFSLYISSCVCVCVCVCVCLKEGVLYSRSKNPLSLIFSSIF